MRQGSLAGWRKPRLWSVWALATSVTMLVAVTAASPLESAGRSCKRMRRSRALNPRSRPATAKALTISSAAKQQWTPLFDGRSLKGWKVANFGGEGEVRVKQGEIQMDFGSSMTGITFNGPLPKMDYEIELEAKRVDGVDFFCGLTFPVNESHCSFIVGGWAGAVVGLSSIDGKDASENDTTTYRKFDDMRWYKIRVRVTKKRIEAWIDNQRVVNQGIVGRTIGIRPEVELSRPLGVSAWDTRAALRNIRLRRLSD